MSDHLMPNTSLLNLMLTSSSSDPSLDSAGYDLNKIIRTEYDEPLYAEMALEAIQAWRDPLFKDVFHETGKSSDLSPSTPADIF